MIWYFYLMFEEEGRWSKIYELESSSVSSRIKFYFISPHISLKALKIFAIVYMDLFLWYKIKSLSFEVTFWIELVKKDNISLETFL